MTGEMINDFEEFSQSSIPSLFYHDHARRNHTENNDVLEYFERWLGDHA